MFEDSANFLLPVATHVVLASCKGAVAIAVVLMCRRLFAPRLSARVRHGLWLVVLAALLLPAGVELPIELQQDPPVLEMRLADGESPAIDLVSAKWTAPAQSDTAISYLATQSHAAGVPSRSISFQHWMVLLWAAVVIALAAIPAWHLVRHLLIARRAQTVSGSILELLLQCKAQMGLRRNVRLRESADIASPAVFGWLFPTLLLPPGLQERFDATQLRHVFLHELAHVRRHDILINWLMTGAQILHWFNPLVWYGLRVMRSDMEQACDARVLAHLSPDEHAAYGHTLIGVWDAFPGRTPAYGLGVVESHGQLKERITMIAKFSSRKSRSPILTAILLLGLASVAATQPQIGAKVPQNTIGRMPDTRLQPATPILTAQAPKPVPAPVPAAAPPVAQRNAVVAESVPAAPDVVPFTVQLLPPEIPGADDAVKASLQKNYLALAAKLRAVPGLMLLTSESAANDGATIDYQIEFKVTVGGDGKQVVRLNASQLSRRPGASGSGTLSGGITTDWGADDRSDSEQELDNFVEIARARVFPSNTSFLQKLLADLRDPKLDYSHRLRALGFLMTPGPPGFASAQDPAVMRGGMEFAVSEADPGRRASIWRRLGDTRSPEVVASLAQALAMEKDEKARIQLAMNLAGNYSANPVTRTALESVARSEQGQISRMIVQHLLTGDGAWNDYVLATLKNPQLTDSQRLEPLSYTRSSSRDVLKQPALDDEAIRIIGSMLARMKTFSDDAGLAAFKLNGLRSPVALEVITEILRPGAGQPMPLREIRDVVLVQLSSTVRSDPRVRALVEDIAAHDADSWIRGRAQALLEELAR